MMAPHFAPLERPRTPMKVLLDFFPILVFFVAFKLADDPHQGVMLATAAAIVATVIQVGFTYWKDRRVERLTLVTLALIVVLGGLTLAFQDERFIKWKPTAVNWLFALVFLGSDYLGAKNLVRRGQSVRGLQLRDRGVGQFQALRARGPHAPVRAGPGAVSDAARRRGGGPGEWLTRGRADVLRDPVRRRR